MKVVSLLVISFLSISSMAQASGLGFEGVYGQASMACIDYQKAREDQAPPKILPQLTLTLTFSVTNETSETYKMVFNEGNLEDRGFVAIDNASAPSDKTFHASTFGSTTNVQWRSLYMGLLDKDTLMIIETMTQDNFGFLVQGSCPIGQNSVLLLKRQK